MQQNHSPLAGMNAGNIMLEYYLRLANIVACSATMIAIMPIIGSNKEVTCPAAEPISDTA